MGIAYAIYSSDGTSDAIDYTTAVATTTGTTFVSVVLAHPGVYAWGIRAYDTATGLEEKNTDCRVDLVLSAANVDISLRPGPPAGLDARATAAGGCRVSWSYAPRADLATPTGFHVFLTAGSAVNFAAAPSATVAYAGPGNYTSDLAGLADEAAYSVGVRAYATAYGDEANTDQVAVSGEVAGPDPVDDIAGAATSGDGE